MNALRIAFASILGFFGLGNFVVANTADLFGGVVGGLLIWAAYAVWPKDQDADTSHDGQEPLLDA